MKTFLIVGSGRSRLQWSESSSILVIRCQPYGAVPLDHHHHHRYHHHSPEEHRKRVERKRQTPWPCSGPIVARIKDFGSPRPRTDRGEATVVDDHQDGWCYYPHHQCRYFRGTGRWPRFLSSSNHFHHHQHHDHDPRPTALRTICDHCPGRRPSDRNGPELATFAVVTNCTRRNDPVDYAKWPGRYCTVETASPHHTLDKQSIRQRRLGAVVVVDAGGVPDDPQAALSHAPR
jgi:hypothetical protein